MFSGPPLPLLPDLPLNWLIAGGAVQRSPDPASGLLGAWFRSCHHPAYLHHTGRSSRPILVSPDLGFLLRHCNHVVVRQGKEPIMLETERLIEWRALQVVTGTPCLPKLERLQAMFPRARLRPDGFQVPISTRSPEDVLAECLTHGVPVAATRIVYCMASRPLPSPSA